MNALLLALSLLAPQKPPSPAALALDPPGLAAGDYDRAAMALLDRVASDPGHPLAPALLLRALSFQEKLADRAPFAARAIKILETCKVPALELPLYRLRAETLLRKGDESALLRGADLFPGYVASGAAIGPFGDGQPDGLAVPYEPERKLALSQEAVGFAGRTVRWQAVSRRPFEVAPDLAWLSDLRGGVRYVRAQIKSPRATTAYLRVEASGSVAAWWNGEEIARLDLATEGRRPLDPAPIVILGGWNQLLLKIEGRGFDWAAARIEDAEGAAIPGLEEESGLNDRLPPVPAVGFRPPAPLAGLDARISMRIEGDDANDVRALRGLVRCMTERSSEGIADLRAAARAEPKRADLQLALAEALLASGYLPDTEAKNRAREAVDVALENSATSVPALVLRADLLARDDRMEEALAALDQAAKANPDGFLVPRARIGVFRKLRWPAEQAKALREAAAKAPNRAELRIELAREAQSDGDAPRERRELDAAAALDATNRSVSERRTSLWLLGSEGALALAERDRFVRLYGNPWDRASLAATLETLGRGTEALEVRRAVAQRLPKDAASRLAVAQLERSLGLDEEAAASYRRALELSPGNAAARTWFRESGGGLADDAFFAAHRVDVKKAIAEYQPSPEDERAPDVLVVDHQSELVLPDGSREAEITSVYRINDARGIELHGSAEFAGEPLELRVVHSDGSYDEPTHAESDFALSKLRAKDFVVIRSRVVDAAEPGERPLLGRFSFRSFERPYRFSQYVLSLPKGTDLRIAERNFDGEHATAEGEQSTEHTFTVRRSERVLAEPFCPAPERILPSVRAGVSSSAEQLNRRFRAAILRSFDVTEEVRAAAQEALAPSAGADDRAKAAALFAFANAQLIERGGGNAVRSLLEKRGSAVALFGGLLRAAEIPFDLGLARPIPAGGDDEPTPEFLEPSRYAEPVLRVRPRDGGEPFWVDLSLRQQPFGALPVFLSGAEVLVTGPAGPSIEHLPPLPEEEWSRPLQELDTTAELTGLKSAHLTIEVTLRNLTAWNLREQVKNLPADERKTIASQIANQLAQGIELESFEFPTLEDRAAPMRIRLTGRLENFLRDGSAGLEAPLLLRPMPLAKRFAGRGERKLPFRLRQPEFARERLRIVPTGALKIADPPAGFAKQSHLASYSLRSAREGDALAVERVFSLRPGEIPPAEFAAFLAACRAAEEADQSKVAISSP